MEGKESQKDILRLRQLEQTKQENGTTSSAMSSIANSESQSSVSADHIGNGYPAEANVMSENN